MVGTGKLAEQLGICPDSVRNLRERGLPYVRLGRTGHPRYDVAAVLKWLRKEALAERKASTGKGKNGVG